MLATVELQRTLMDLAVLFGLCIAVSLVFHRLKVPPLVGFLVAGALFGPHGFGLVNQPELVDQLAEIGVIVLLFSVGMELSLAQLVRMKSAVLVAGGLQLAGTIALGAAAGALGGLPAGQAIFVGFLLSLSSTAAISKLLHDRGELGTPPGRIAISICVAQDLAVVPMILLLPLLAIGADVSFGGAALGVLRSLVFLLLATAAAGLVFPRVLDIVVRTRSRELFVLAVIGLCLGMALTTAWLGMSLALGALIGGVILGGSVYRHQAVSEVEPFRDALASLFFVSIGMLFDPAEILAAPGLVLLALAAVIGGKALVASLAVEAMHMPRWVALHTGLMVAQVGEFSFVLVGVAGGHGLVPGHLREIFMVVAVLSIAATPFTFVLARHAGRRHRGAKPTGEGERVRPREHVVIVGFGPTGSSLASALDALGIPYQAIEMNAETVKAQQAKGVPIRLGDASRATVLRAAGIERARLLVLAINDPGATLRIATQARRIAPDLHILARATFLHQVSELREAGVDEIVPLELETSAEILVRSLRHFLVPDDEVGRQTARLREALHIDKMAPKAEAEAPRLQDFLPGLEVMIFHVEADSPLAGRPLGEMHLRRDAGINVVAFKRGEATSVEIGPETVFEPGDVVVVLGPARGAADAAVMFRGSSLSGPGRERAAEKRRRADPR